MEVKKRKGKEKRETKSKEFESKCKKISQFFPNVNKQLADPTSIKSLSYDSQVVEAIDFESTAHQTFDPALHTESENKGMSDVNQSMQTSTDLTDSNSNDPTLLENIDVEFRRYILENGLNQKTNISFTNSKRTYDDGINHYLKNRDTIKRNWLLCLAHFISRFNDWKHINRLCEQENSESQRNASPSAASFKTKNAGVDHSLLVQIEEKVCWRAMLKRAVAVVKFLCERGLPLRWGNEVFGSPQNGNFLGLLELFDDFPADHIRRFSNSGKDVRSYLSSTICNEFVQLMAKEATTKILV